MSISKFPSPKKRARIRNWRGKLYVIWWDYAKGCERRLSCEAAGATTDERRKELVDEYRRTEDLGRATAQQGGKKTADDTPVIDALNRYLAYVDEQAVVREVGKDQKRREGLSTKSRIEYHSDIKRFIAWLEARGHGRLATGGLDATYLKAYLSHLAAERVMRGGRKFARSGASLNKHRRSIKACLNYLRDIRPPLFPDLDLLCRALKPVHADYKKPIAFTPHQLTAFLQSAIEYDKANKRRRIKRRRAGRSQSFLQRVQRPATPVSELFLLLALTGARLAEALALRWDSVDLERGRITIFAQKTGYTRTLPLSRAPECNVAPEFLNLLACWRKSRPDDPFVLSHRGIDKPAYPKAGWNSVALAVKIREMTPQRLRQNFTSYAASLRIPQDVEALWLGHSPEVAARSYRAQVLERCEGPSMEAAMGLTTLLGGKGMNEGAT